MSAITPAISSRPPAAPHAMGTNPSPKRAKPPCVPQKPNASSSTPPVARTIASFRITVALQRSESQSCGELEDRSLDGSRRRTGSPEDLLQTPNGVRSEQTLARLRVHARGYVL